MARISFSALVEQITGKLAGSVFQDSYFGMQIRTRVSPNNPRSKYQQLRRGEFGYLSAGWRNLTDTQRQTFIDNSIGGLSGLNFYLQSNVNLTLIEEPVITTYVPSSDPGTMSIEFVDVTPSLMTIRATGAVTTVPTGTKLLVQVTYQKAPTKIFTNPSQYSPVISFDEGTDLSIPTDIFTEWSARYGVALPDKRQCLKANLIDKSNGLRGADVTNCINSTDMAVKYIPLFADASSRSNVSTGNTSLQSDSIPANTINADLQKIICSYEFQLAGGIAAKTIQFIINGNTWTFNNITSSANTRLDVWLMRKDSTHMNGSYILSVDGHSVEVATATLSGFDFTAAIVVEVKGQGTASNQITLQASWIDQVKEP